MVRLKPPLQFRTASASPPPRFFIGKEKAASAGGNYERLKTCRIEGSNAKKWWYLMQKPTVRYEFANILRGVAVLCVLFEHYLGFYIGDQNVISRLIHMPTSEIDRHVPSEIVSVTHSIPYLIPASFGVALFFIISGFVIPLSLTNSTRKEFLISRVLRIYPTYIVGFAVTMVALLISTSFAGVELTIPASDIILHAIPGLREIVGVPFIDGIIWTLEIELKFYAIGFVFISAFKNNSLSWIAIPVALMVAAFLANELISLSPINQSINSFPFLIYMFIGVCFNAMATKRLSYLNGSILIAAIFAMFISAFKVSPSYELIIITVSYFYAVLFFAFFFCIRKYIRPVGPLSFLASISYPLYVMHGIAGYVMLRILGEYGLTPLQALPITVATMLAIAWCIHILVEEPTRKWGKTRRVIPISAMPLSSD